MNRLDGAGDDAAVLAAVVMMSRALGLVVIAERVETERQRAELLRLGCPQAQGSLFARPLPADDAEVALGNLMHSAAADQGTRASVPGRGA